MQTRYSVWKVNDGVPSVATTQESHVQYDGALAIIDELVAASLNASLSGVSVGDIAWISFFDPPRVLHIYVRAEPNRLRYECFDGVNEGLTGDIRVFEGKGAVRVLFEGQSPLPYLKSHSLEIVDGAA